MSHLLFDLNANQSTLDFYCQFCTMKRDWYWHSMHLCAGPTAGQFYSIIFLSFFLFSNSLSIIQSSLLLSSFFDFLSFFLLFITFFLSFFSSLTYRKVYMFCSVFSLSHILPFWFSLPFSLSHTHTPAQSQIHNIPCTFSLLFFNVYPS